MERVKHDNAGRFYLRTEHGDAELLYRIEGNVISVYHTFTPDEERGNGIAEKLAVEAFKFASEKHFKVRPDCTYIQYFVEKHKELRSMVVQGDTTEEGSCALPPKKK